MKQKLFIFTFSLLGFVACQSGIYRDSYALSGSKKNGAKPHGDSYSAASRRGRPLQFYDSYSSSSRKRRGMQFQDSYSNTNKRKKVKEESDSYSSTVSKKRSWKFWKKDPRGKTSKAYNVSRKRKVILKRKPPQGIKAS